MFLSEDQGDLHSGSCPPDLWLVVRLGDIELPDESHQERLYLHEAAQRVVLSILGETKDMNSDRRTRTASPRSS